MRAARGRERGPGGEEGQGEAGAEGEDARGPPGAAGGRAGAERRPAEGGQPEGGLVLHQRGEAEEQAREEERAPPDRPPLVGDEGDRPGRGQEQDELGVGREHVVGQERRPVDEPQEARGDAAPVVTERGGRGERHEGHGHDRGHGVDGEEPPAEEQLGEGVVAVEEGRLVVDEVGVEPSAVEQHPRPHGVGGLVHVEDLHHEREPAGQQADQDEQREEAEDEPATCFSDDPGTACRRFHALSGLSPGAAAAASRPARGARCGSGCDRRETPSRTGRTVTLGKLGV